MIESFPLAWPVGWKRTPSHQRCSSDYKVNFLKARDDLARELGMLSRRSSDVVISSNVPTRRDGLPYANQREPNDPGIAAYWITRDGQQRVIACDAWRTVRENMRAVGLAVAAFRMIQRTKATEILDRAFMGFAALPPAKTWWAVLLGVSETATAEEIEAAYRMLAKRSHPDTGGSHDLMTRLNRARDEALQRLRDERPAVI